MTAYLVGLAAALVSGIFVCLQGVFNASLQRYIGLIGLLSWIHFVGFVFSLPLIAAFKPDLVQALVDAKQHHVSLAVLLSGVLGLVIVPGVAYAVANVGPAPAFSALVVGQLLVSLVFQNYGLMGTPKQEIQMPQIVAMGLVVAGTWIFFLQR